MVTGQATLLAIAGASLAAVPFVFLIAVNLERPIRFFALACWVASALVLFPLALSYVQTSVEASVARAFWIPWVIITFASVVYVDAKFDTARKR